MCLNLVDLKKTREIWRDIRASAKRGKVELFKVFLERESSYGEKFLITAVRKTPVKLDRNRYFISNRRTKRVYSFERSCRQIFYGIHSYIHLSDANSLIRKLGDFKDSRILKVQVRLKDVVAVGKDYYGSLCVVSTRIRIPKYRRRISKRKNR